MIRRNTWIVLAVFAVLIGVTWYLQGRPDEEPAVETTPNPGVEDLFTFERADIASLQIYNALGQVVELEEGGDGAWALLAPLAEPADSAKIDLALSQLTELTSFTKLDPAPDLSIVGLAPSPSYTITVGMKDNQEWLARVGKQTPTQSGYYFQVNGGPVYVVSKFSVEEITGLVEQPPVLATPAGAITETITATVPLAPTQTSAPTTATVTKTPGPTLQATSEPVTGTLPAGTEAATDAATTPAATTPDLKLETPTKVP